MGHRHRHSYKLFAVLQTVVRGHLSSKKGCWVRMVQMVDAKPPGSALP